MSSTFRILFLARKTKLNKEGLATINIRLTIDSKSVEFSTKIFVDPNLWNAKSGRMDGKSKTATEINNSLNAMLARLKIKHQEILDRDGYVTSEKLRDVFLGKIGLRQKLLELFDEKIIQMDRLVGTTIKQGEVDKFIGTKKRLAEFLLKEYNEIDIGIQNVNTEFITQFNTFLRSQYKNKDNTVVNYLRKLKQITTQALKKHYISIDPFLDIKLSSKPGKRHYLTENELKIIISKDFDSKTLNEVRDVFIFCCFTGLSYIDVSNLKKEDIKENDKGEKYLINSRIKTGVEAYVPLLDVPLSILDKYQKNTDIEEKLLPIRRCQNLNTYLKKIATICNINKKLTTHVARHSFATLMLTKGISIESVSKMLGHTEIKTTQIYAQILNEKVDNEVNQIKGELNKLNDLLMKN